MYRGIFAFALLAFAADASAQQVFKCVERGKPPSYQSQPCANGDAAKAWDAVPQAENPYLKARLARMQRQVDARRASDRAASTYGGGATGASIGGRSNYACESAKRQRAAVYEAAGTRRSFSLSSAMDNAVHDACK